MLVKTGENIMTKKLNLIPRWDIFFTILSPISNNMRHVLDSKFYLVCRKKHEIVWRICDNVSFTGGIK